MSGVTTNFTNLTVSVPTDQASAYGYLFAGLGLTQDDTQDADDFSDDDSSNSSLTASTNSSGDEVVDDGTYTFTMGGENDGSVEVTDDATGANVTSAWGDPHYDDASGNNVANAQTSAVTETFSDGTTMTVDPTATTNGVAHIASVTISDGNQQVVTNANSGSGQGFQNGVLSDGVDYVPDAAANARDSNASGVNIDVTSDGDLFAANNYTGGLTKLTPTAGAPVNLDTDQQATGASSSAGSQTSPVQAFVEIFQQLEAGQQQENQLEQLLSEMLGGGSSSYGGVPNLTNLFGPSLYGSSSLGGDSLTNLL